MAIAPDVLIFFFFFNDPATTEIYTLSLHDALPILECHIFPVPLTRHTSFRLSSRGVLAMKLLAPLATKVDRKSTRLNSSHGYISYAVFCLKKKKNSLQPYVTTYSSSLRTSCTDRMT